MGTFFHTIYKNNQNGLKGLNIRPKPIKLLGENVGRTLFGINGSNIFFFWICLLKQKTNKWDLIKCKNFCMAKKTISNRKIQSTEWEKIFANMTDKGLISKVYKQLILETNKNKKTNLIKKKNRQKT